MNNNEQYNLKSILNCNVYCNYVVFAIEALLRNYCLLAQNKNYRHLMLIKSHFLDWYIYTLHHIVLKGFMI